MNCEWITLLEPGYKKVAESASNVLVTDTIPQE